MVTRRSLLLSGLASLPLHARSDPAAMSLEDAQRMIRRRQITPLELVDACLKRIEDENPRLNGFITVLGEQARAQALALSPRDRNTRPLHGLPIALKDLYDTAGVRTTAGSAHWRDRTPGQDAVVVQRLRTAGAIIIGKTNMDEFAYHFTSETSNFKATRNPWNTACTPGGSSGGSAVAVASAMCVAALGSDTAGSVRLPAALCGITGFKPTWGSVPLDGAAPLSWTNDTYGPMTRSAVDAAIVHAVLSGRPMPISSVKRLRIGVPREMYWDGLQPAVAAAVEAAVGVLRNVCAEVRDVRIPPVQLGDTLPMPALLTTVISAEAYAFHRDMLRRIPDSYHPGTRATIEGGRAVDAATYIDARREHDRLRETAAAALFKDADILLTPTAPGVAFPLGSSADLVYLRNTAPWNLYGLPSISIPCGVSDEGLPVGLQLTGKPNADAILLSVAAAFQRDSDYHARRPVLSE